MKIPRAHFVWAQLGIYSISETGRAGATNFDLEGQLIQKEALGGRGPFLSEPTFISADAIRMQLFQGLR